jgi:hypothetical protein
MDRTTGRAFADLADVLTDLNYGLRGHSSFVLMVRVPNGPSPPEQGLQQLQHGKRTSLVVNRTGLSGRDPLKVQDDGASCRSSKPVRCASPEMTAWLSELRWRSLGRKVLTGPRFAWAPTLQASCHAGPMASRGDGCVVGSCLPSSAYVLLSSLCLSMPPKKSRQVVRAQMLFARHGGYGLLMSLQVIDSAGGGGLATLSGTTEVGRDGQRRVGQRCGGGSGGGDRAGLTGKAFYRPSLGIVAWATAGVARADELDAAQRPVVLGLAAYDAFLQGQLWRAATLGGRAIARRTPSARRCALRSTPSGCRRWPAGTRGARWPL